MRNTRIVLAVLWLIGLPSGAWGQSGALEDVEVRRHQVTAELQVLRQRLKGIGLHVAGARASLMQSRHTTRLLEKRKLALDARLRSGVQNLMTVVLALDDVQRGHTAVFLAANPLEAVQALEASLSLAPQLEYSVQQWQETLVSLRTIEAHLETQTHTSQRLLANLGQKESELTTLVAQRTELMASLETRFQDLQREAEQLARDSTTLEELSDNVQMTNTRLTLAPRLARGRLILPIAGTITKRFKQKLASGQVSHGLVIQPMDSSLVLSPYDGSITFAGRFKSHGGVVIMDHGHDYHSVLTGLRDIDVITGQRMLKGEPMGRHAEQAQVYYELRHHGKPVDPLLWIEALDSQQRGTP